MTAEKENWAAVRQIINSKPIEDNETAKAFLSVLKEFKELLNSTYYMRAYLRAKSRDTLPQIWSLSTRPRFRPSEGSIMLTIAIYPDFVRILGEEKEIGTAASLSDRLSHFVTDTYFPATVAEYQSRFKEDATGALQVEKHNGPTTKDTIVVLPWVEHNRLGELAEKGGGQATFVVRIDHAEGFPNYDQSIKYRFLCSMGYFLEISSMSEIKGDCIEVTGTIEPFLDRSDDID